MLVKPWQLRARDRIAAVTLSWGGAGLFPERYAAGKRQLEDEFGVRVVEMPHTLRDPGWIARNPRARADDLMQAFADPEIHLDLRVQRAAPKVFLGRPSCSVPAPT